MKQLTPNQVVAHNLRAARDHRGWTQERAAAELEPYLGERWSRVVFSAAERSVSGERVRHFTADHLLAFSAAFELPISFFLYNRPRDAQVAAPNGEPFTDETLERAAGGLDEARAAVLAATQKRIEGLGTLIIDEPKDD